MQFAAVIKTFSFFRFLSSFASPESITFENTHTHTPAKIRSKSAGTVVYLRCILDASC